MTNLKPATGTTPYRARVTKKRCVNVWLPHDVTDYLKACAEKDHRALTGFLSVTLIKWVEAQKQAQADGGHDPLT